MATHSRREVTTTRVEFIVPAKDPWGAAWADVTKAVSEAVQELRDVGRSIADDTISLRPGDEEIIVWYEVVEARAEG